MSQPDRARISEPRKTLADAVSETQPEATAALDEHIRENACDPTRDRGQEPPACRKEPL